MNYVYTKEQIINMKKVEKSLKKSKPKSVEDFLKLVRT
jgi:hypothetical protein